MVFEITWFLTAVATVLVGCLSTLLWRRRFANQADPSVPLPLPPGSFGLPLIGEMLDLAIKGSRFYSERYERYGRIHKTHYVGSPTVRVLGADLVAPLIRSEPASVSAKSTRSLRRLFGPNAVTSLNGDAHARVKKHILEAFTRTRLSDYIPCIQEHVRAHLKSWCDRGPMLGFKACEALVCDLSLELLLGCSTENDAHEEVRKAFSTVNKNFFCLPFRIPGLGLDKGLKARKIIEDFVQDRLKTKSDKDHTSCIDVLNYHRENEESHSGKSRGLSAKEIEDNAVTLMVAASGTTSGAMTCSLMLLARHPDVMERLRQELDENGLLSDDCPDELTFEMLGNLEFTHCVIKEVLRLHPPAGGVFRQANKTLELNGYQIPKDWTIVYSISYTHNLSTAMEDPSSFRPERWMDKELSRRLKEEDYGTYMPYGLGPRGCPGKNLANLILAVFLVEVIRLTTFKVNNTHPKMVVLPVTKPADDLPVTFAKL